MRKYFFLLLLFFGQKKTETSYLNADNTWASKESVTTRPNIILIVGDDVGYELLTCNGGQSYETPHLDAMAHDGVRFTNCNGSPLCAPSRTMILTGKYNFRNYAQWSRMDLSNKTIGNMMQDAGYTTCYAGKWQLGGFEKSVHALGFEKYSIWDPYKGSVAGNRYKSPHIYQGGGFLPDGITLNKYADDWFTDYIFNFIDSTSKPYFVYYSMSLCHAPFSPTPDDPVFANWNPNSKNDPGYFRSMVKYMDKKIGEILDKVDENTIVIFVGDNGTPKNITSKWNGISIDGGKGQTTLYGTHVPLIVYRKKAPAYVDTSLVDFTDFLPTLASIANISVPANYGILDGTSFYPHPSTRQWIFCHYQPVPVQEPENLTRWVQNSVYKKYDLNVADEKKSSKFFNIILDPYEQKPISPQQTSNEKAVDSLFTAILRTMHN